MSKSKALNIPAEAMVVVGLLRKHDRPSAFGLLAYLYTREFEAADVSQIDHFVDFDEWMLKITPTEAIDAIWPKGDVKR